MVISVFCTEETKYNLLEKEGFKPLFFFDIFKRLIRVQLQLIAFLGKISTVYNL